MPAERPSAHPTTSSPAYPGYPTHRPSSATPSVRGDTGGASYWRRQPENSILYRVVSAELDGLKASLAEASPYGVGLPRHVERALEAFLRCGLLCHGFARVVCRSCRVEHLVAFSCKGRGISTSCHPAHV